MRVFDEVFPTHSIPERLDDASLRTHALSAHLLERAVVTLPSVRYRGFRVEPPISSIPTVASTSKKAVSTADSAEDSAVAWRFQQRREFMPFEDRVKRVSMAAATAATAAPALEGNGVAPTAAVGDHAGGGGAISDGGTAVGAKILPVVLADYLGDASTIGMAMIDQPGTGLTTALLSFLEWYCRGEMAGGRRVRHRTSLCSMDADDNILSPPTQSYIYVKRV